MVISTSTTHPRRVARGKRIHVRRLKQAARRAGTTYSKPI